MKRFRPETIKIFGRTYNVVYVEHASEACSNGDVANVGEVNFWTQTIRVCVGNKKQGTVRPDDAVLQTILHECVHAIAKKMALDLNEDDTDRMATGMVDLLLSNGWMK